MVDMPTEEEYRANKRLIDVVDTSNLLENPHSKRRVKLPLLEQLGITETMRGAKLRGGKRMYFRIKLSDATPEELHDQFRAICYQAVEENRVYDQENQ
ncbi:MAG: hypothetical protein ABIH59_03060 [archaeon]